MPARIVSATERPPVTLKVFSNHGADYGSFDSASRPTGRMQIGPSSTANSLIGKEKFFSISPRPNPLKRKNAAPRF